MNPFHPRPTPDARASLIRLVAALAALDLGLIAFAVLRIWR